MFIHSIYGHLHFSTFWLKNEKLCFEHWCINLCSYTLPFLLCIYLRVKSLCHMVILCLIEELLNCFIMSGTIWIPTNKVWMFHFFLFLSTLNIAHLFYSSHANDYDIVSHYSFDYVSLTNDIDYMLMCLLAMCISYLEKCRFK